MPPSVAAAAVLATLALAGPAPPWLWTAASGPGVDRALAAAVVVTGLALVRRPGPHALAWIAAALAVIAAWPVMSIPFTTDAQVLRAAFARLDLFADWNHPFLPYLLNRPVASVSMEPEHLRLVPLAFAAATGALLTRVVYRRAGAAAAWLAGVWWAAELRERHGLTDLGDWDFAAAFLVAWLTWLDDEADGLGRAAGLAGLVVAGMLCSWLMVVPAAALTLTLWLEVAAGRRRALTAALPTAAAAAVAAWARVVYHHGAALGPPSERPLRQLFDELAAELPTDRAPAMAVPLALGLMVLVVGARRAPERFSALSLVAVPAALAWSWVYSHVNGGYYFGLVTPLVLWAAALGTGRAIAALPPRAVPFAVAAIALATTSAARFPFLSWTAGAERVPAIEAEVREQGTPLVTNWADLGRVAAWERSRRGEGQDGDMIEYGPPEIVAATRALDEARCLPAGGWPDRPFLLVLVQPDRVIRQGCDPERLTAATCEALDPDVQPVPFCRTWRCAPR